MKLITLDPRRLLRPQAEPAQPDAIPSARGPGNGRPELRVVQADTESPAPERTAPAIRRAALTVEIQEYGKTLVLAVDGVVDLHTAPTIRHALAEALNRGPRRLIVDLSLVQFLNSAGLEALLAAHRQAAPRTDLRLVATTRATWRPLQITRLHEQLIIHTSRAQAITAPARRAYSTEPVTGLRSIPAGCPGP